MKMSLKNAVTKGDQLLEIALEQAEIAKGVDGEKAGIAALRSIASSLAVLTQGAWLANRGIRAELVSAAESEPEPQEPTVEEVVARRTKLGRTQRDTVYAGNKKAKKKHK